jgi:predicted metal-dependent phosphoesterase TrpH
MQLESIIDMASKRHIDCLAITDHNTIHGAFEMKEIAPPWLNIIVGEEVKTTEGEIIGFFLREEIPPRMSPRETVAAIKEQGGLVSIPHPFDRVRPSRLDAESLLAVVSDVDIIEVWNSRTSFQVDNVKAEEFARRFNKLQGAGSDAHVEYELGKAYVEMPRFATKEEFLLSLAQGHVVGRRSNPLVHLFSTWAKLRKKYMR